MRLGGMRIDEDGDRLFLRYRIVSTFMLMAVSVLGVVFLGMRLIVPVPMALRVPRPRVADMDVRSVAACVFVGDDRGTRQDGDGKDEQ